MSWGFILGIVKVNPPTCTRGLSVQIVVEYYLIHTHTRKLKSLYFKSFVGIDCCMVSIKSDEIRVILDEQSKKSSERIPVRKIDNPFIVGAHNETLLCQNLPSIVPKSSW